MLTSLLKKIYFPLLILWRLPRRIFGFPTIGACAIVIRDGKEVLLVRHTYRDGWFLPGGGLKRGESPVQGVTRELYEETGTIPQEEPQLLCISHASFGGADDYPVLYKVTTFKQEDASCFEIAEQRFFPIDALPEATSPSTRAYIEKYAY